MNTEPSPNILRKVFLVLGILSAIGLAGYALAYLIVMPQVSPDGFVPKTLDNGAETSLTFGSIQALFILLYAFSLLPVTIMFTVKKYRTNPYALILACCLLGVSSLLEIINNLPVFAESIYPANPGTISSDVLLYLTQTEAIRYLAFDVVGFSLIYAAVFVYAVIYYRSYRWLSYTIIGSIALFIFNVPFLWFIPNMAVILMALSVIALVPVPIFLANQSIELHQPLKVSRIGNPRMHT